MKIASFYLAISLFIGLALASCNKENPVEPESIDTNDMTEIYAGIYDSSFSVYSFQPGFQVTITWDSQKLYGNGYDSLDLDSDGSFDLFISLSILNFDSIHLLNGLPNPFPYCKLPTSSEFVCAFYSEGYPIGLGQTATARFVDRFDLNERIDSIVDWATTYYLSTC